MKCNNIKIIFPIKTSINILKDSRSNLAQVLICKPFLLLSRASVDPQRQNHEKYINKQTNGCNNIQKHPCNANKPLYNNHLTHTPKPKQNKPGKKYDYKYYHRKTN
jgi:hypothetical protein